MTAASGCAPPMPPRPAGQYPLTFEVAAIVLTPRLDKGLIGALNDPLRADIDPRAGGHLAVHRQALLIELVEMVPGRPVRHEVGIGDQNARRILVRAENADRLAGLHQQRLVFGERLQRRDDAVEVLPGAGGAADAAIDDQFVRIFRHVRIEIVHQHAQRRFGHPALGVELGSARRPDFADVVTGIAHLRSPVTGGYLRKRTRSARRSRRVC